MASENVLDASAFYAGMPFLSSGEKYYTTSAVFREVEHIRSSISALEALREAGNLIIVDPGKESTVVISAAARKTGDFPRLSAADISILALANQLNAILFSDDYAIANVAAAIGISVSHSSGKGITEIRKWISYCSACGRAFGPVAGDCPLCGNRLKRRFKKLPYRVPSDRPVDH